MIDIAYILFLSWVVIYADFHITKHNVGTTWNGVGVIPSVLAGSAKSPMQYRVLIPWICGFLSRWFGSGEHKFAHLYAYLRIKWIAIMAALAGSFWYFGQVCNYPHIAVGLMAAFFVWAAIYDYADMYLEVAFLAVAFASMGTEYALLVASVVAFIAALNRETAVLIPIVLLLSGPYRRQSSLVVSLRRGCIYQFNTTGRKNGTVAGHCFARTGGSSR